MILTAHSRTELDVALATARPLAKAMPQGAKVSARFVQKIYPKMKRALRLGD